LFLLFFWGGFVFWFVCLFFFCLGGVFFGFFLFCFRFCALGVFCFIFFFVCVCVCVCVCLGIDMELFVTSQQLYMRFNMKTWKYLLKRERTVSHCPFLISAYSRFKSCACAMFQGPLILLSRHRLTKHIMRISS
jgi:hypothetical protein